MHPDDHTQASGDHIHASGDHTPSPGDHTHEPGEPPHTHPDPAVDPHAALPTGGARALRIGIGGPVGSGKTALVAALCHNLAGELNMAVVTNDIYTTEDADFLLRNAVMPPERVRAVETGCCPHTAIRDDIAANLDAVEDLEASLGPLDLVLVESGGDNLTATFSRGLVDRQIFVIDVAGGDKVPRKGGPGVTSADLLVINKTDLAPLVGADLGVMERDAAARRGNRPTVFLSLVQDRAAHPGRRLDPGATQGMRATARIVAEPDGRGGTRLTELYGEVPLLARRTGPGEVHLVGGAAGPLGGDDLSIDIRVAADARLVVRTVAASVALPGSGRSRTVVTATVHGRLEWLPEPVVAARRCDHLTAVPCGARAGGVAHLA